MACDIYVGPLTLYYAGEWENAGQRYARMRGASYSFIRPDGEEPAADPDEVREAVVTWRDALAEVLQVRIPGPLTWDETGTLYASERPNWDGFSSLVLWAAYAEHPDLERPAVEVEHYREDPAYLRCTAEGGITKYSHIVRDLEFWLPWPFDGTLMASDPNGNVVGIGSSITLARQLGELNQATWRADEATLEQWRSDVPARGSSFETLARFGFATVFDLAVGAAKMRLPMKLDY